MKLNAMAIACVLLAATGACDRTQTRQDTHATFEQLSERGRELCRDGHYIEGLTLLQAAADSLETMHPDSINPEGAVRLLGNIGNLYQRMGMFDEAKAANSRAMAIAEAKVPSRLQDLWRMRGMTYEITNQPDSQLVCLHRAVEACSLVENEKWRRSDLRHNRTFLAVFYLEHPEYAPDSIASARRTLEHINPDFSVSRLLIGYAYVLEGNYAKGIPMMEDAVKIFRTDNDRESLEWSLQYLARAYAKAGDRKLIDIYPEAASLHDSIKEELRSNLLLGMDFKYRTSQLKRETAVLQAELRTRQQRTILISVIGLLVMAGLVVFLIMRSRNHRQKQQLSQQNIDTLLAERIALNTKIEELNRRQAESNANTNTSEALPAILLEKEDEKRFRKSFNDLHPGFIDNLRKNYPDLTSGNELLCMLIALRRRNEEIALALGISRDSVATSRYRLRTRFNLPKDVDLNDFIQSML